MGACGGGEHRPDQPGRPPHPRRLTVVRESGPGSDRKDGQGNGRADGKEGVLGAGHGHGRLPPHGRVADQGDPGPDAAAASDNEGAVRHRAARGNHECRRGGEGHVPPRPQDGAGDPSGDEEAHVQVTAARS